MAREMSGRGNVRSGKCLSGEMSSRVSVLQGSVRSGNCPFGEMSIGEVSVGEVSVGELSSRGTVQSGNCPHTVLNTPLMVLVVRGGTVEFLIQTCKNEHGGRECCNRNKQIKAGDTRGLQTPEIRGKVHERLNTNNQYCDFSDLHTCPFCNVCTFKVFEGNFMCYAFYFEPLRVCFYLLLSFKAFNMHL